MRKYGKVSILGPDRNWSGGGHVKTSIAPCASRKFQLADGTLAYASDGAPSDCVSLAALGYFKEPVDLVVSVSMWAPISARCHLFRHGTAAMEAVIANLPVSQFHWKRSKVISAAWILALRRVPPESGAPCH